MVFRIKICGVKTREDIVAVADSHADAIGLNFFPPSVRFVDPTAKQTVELSQLASNSGLVRVGVFVNESPQAIADICDRVGLDVVQLHGDETIEIANEVKLACHLPTVRAIKLPAGPLDQVGIDKRCGAWIEAGFSLLLDADAGSAYGGSGKQLDWNSVGTWSSARLSRKWALAGGLNVDNVSEAIAKSVAPAVDTASGVEASKGLKSAEMILAFASTANDALKRIHG